MKNKLNLPIISLVVVAYALVGHYTEGASSLLNFRRLDAPSALLFLSEQVQLQPTLLKYFSRYSLIIIKFWFADWTNRVPAGHGKPGMLWNL